MKIKYQALGGNHMVTGSCHLLDIDGFKIMIDFGTVQDNTKSPSQIYKMNARKLPIDFSEIDVVLVTHVHADHTQLLGILPSSDFSGKILTTALTAELMDINLRDGAYLHNKEIERVNKRRKNKLTPLFTMRSVEKVLSQVRGYSFNQEIKLSDNIKVELLPAGHIPGSCMPLITVKDGYNNKKILFTGDTSGDNRNLPFTMKPDLSKMKINTVVSESTYGNRQIEESDKVEELYNHVKETCIKNKGTLVSPVFAISRSTNMLMYLKQAYDKHEDIRKIPIYFASPMAIKSHFRIGDKNNFVFYDKEWEQFKDLWKWNKVTYIDNFEDVQRYLDNGNPKIIYSSSGMCTGGYISYILGNFLPNKRSKVLFCGYQANGSIGRKILEKKQKSVNVGGKQVRIRADVDFLGGMSSHASGDDIIDMFNKIDKKKLKNVIITHGDYEQSLGLKRKFEQNFKNINTYIPKYGQEISI